MPYIVNLSNRKFSNFLRRTGENWIPPALRDSRLFYFLIWLGFRKDAAEFVQFRPKAARMTPKDVDAYYGKFHLPELFTTDLNQACTDEIIRNTIGPEVIDVGCGRGFLAKALAERTSAQVSGVDFLIVPKLEAALPQVRFTSASLEKLPFADRAFDTVTCTHTLEHMLDFDRAVAELRRIAKRRLIVVVPAEREALYSFNMHLHFFPYPHSLVNRMRPSHDRFRCELIDGDLYYQEEIG